jgi:hypothetical protein
LLWDTTGLLAQYTNYYFAHVTYYPGRPARRGRCVVARKYIQRARGRRRQRGRRRGRVRGRCGEASRHGAHSPTCPRHQPHGRVPGSRGPPTYHSPRNEPARRQSSQRVSARARPPGRPSAARRCYIMAPPPARCPATTQGTRARAS